MSVVYVIIKENVIMAWMEESRLFARLALWWRRNFAANGFSRGLHPGISHEDYMVKKRVFNRAVKH